MVCPERAVRRNSNMNAWLWVKQTMVSLSNRTSVAAFYKPLRLKLLVYKVRVICYINLSKQTSSSTTVYETQVTELSLIFPAIFATTFQNHLFKVEQHFIKNELLIKSNA